MTEEAAGSTSEGAPEVRAGGIFDPRLALATTVHSDPGVYALLLGAGISMGAGVKVGWDIVKDLVSRAATAAEPEDEKAGPAAAADPEAWWEQHGEGPLSYSGLLDKIAPGAPSARQAQLRRYFQPQPDEAGEIIAVAPAAAHRAIAQLVLRGSIRVILTTNFDRLLEHALEEVGLSPQVIHNPDDFDAATPLAHSRVTIIKLHGDWRDLHLRNTVTELTKYPEAQQTYLERVLDEYGLIVSGWSAESDHALAGALARTRTRRYPLFWSHFGAVGEAARNLIAQHKATFISGMTADAFFEDLLSRLQALDRMTKAPLGREVAVTRLKRALLEPNKSIELHDLLTEAVERVAAATTPERYPLGPAGSYEEIIGNARADTDTLMHLVATGVFHDDGRHTEKWIKIVKRLSGLRRPFGGSFDSRIESLRHYPALLVTWTAAVAAVLAGRDEVLHFLLSEPKWTTTTDSRGTLPAAIYLSPYGLLNDAKINEFHTAPGPRQPWICPQSRLIREHAREAFAALEPDGDTYEAACDRLEFLASMISMDATPENQMDVPWHGEFIFHDLAAVAERIKTEIAPGWPLLEAGAFGGDVDRALAAYVKVLAWAVHAASLRPWI